MSIRRSIGALLIFVGLAQFAVYVSWLSSRNLDVLVEPILLRPGSSTFRFYINVKEGYHVDLEGSTKLPRSQAICTLGINPNSDYSRLPCHDQSTLLIDWALASDRRPTVHYSSDSEHGGRVYDNGEFLKDLGEFAADKGNYVLTVNVKTAEQSLSGMPATLRVQISSVYTENALLRFLISGIVGLFLLICGIVLIIRSRRE